MLQYNTKGEIQDTYFVDLQVPKWGSVTQDLLLLPFVLYKLGHKNIKV